MANDEKWQRARLFPVTGIGNPNEQERRGCSVLLAILSSVKEFGRALTTAVAHRWAPSRRSSRCLLISMARPTVPTG